MIYCKKEKVQRDLYYAIIDEADSILIDESNTPLVISNISKSSTKIYKKINDIVLNNFIKKLKNKRENNFFSLKRDLKQISLKEDGFIFIEKLVKQFFLIKNNCLYSSKNINLLHYILNSLKAHFLFKKNIDYIVQNNSIFIINENTGRIMFGRKLSDGLHQAIEAKENVFIHNNNETLISTTFQNYFKLYKKLSGMTGTAQIVSHELNFFYQLETFTIPTNKKIIRNDMNDLIFTSNKNKINAIINDILHCYKKNQPVLVGTNSIEKSELISSILKKLQIKHNILNAKFHKKEAKIIENAGKPKAITIATNMAGRGTDIILGGSKKYIISKKEYQDWKRRNKIVLKSGGLHIIGMERNISRRIDDQLKGRSGRQGDPGSSRFYLSFEDNLIKNYFSERFLFFIKNFNFIKKNYFYNNLIMKFILKTQNSIENKNFNIRKHLIKYDNIINIQRIIVYKYRNYLVKVNNISNIIKNIQKDVVLFIVNKFFKYKYVKIEKILLNLENYLKIKFNITIIFCKKLYLKNFFYVKKKIITIILQKFFNKYKNLIYKFGLKNVQIFEKNTMLKYFDILWKEQTVNMYSLYSNIFLHSYTKKNLIFEYQKICFFSFLKMIKILKYKIIQKLNNII